MAFTFFFRDAQTLELALDAALPSLRGRAFIHIWDAGCAHGPEPYTLAILLRERMSEFLFRNVRIHATDVDTGFAAQVTGGVFPEAELRRVPAAIREKYFAPAHQPAFLEAIPALRARIEFAQHDLLSLRPIRDGLSLVVCKNVLLHLEESERLAVLRMFYEALQPGGLVVLECTQKMPEPLAPYFQQIAPYAQVYRKAERTYVEHPPEAIRPAFHGETAVPRR